MSERGITSMAENEKEVQATDNAPAPSSKKIDKASDSKPNVFVRFGRKAKKIWRDYVSELRKVVWMPWKDVKKSTLLVCVTVVAIGVAIGVVDFVFSEVIGGIAGLIG